MIDVLVAGAGPVGLAVSIGAALSGLETVVVDPRSSPIDKACGEGLMPAALASLAEMGVDPPGFDFTGIRYVAPGACALARFDAGPGRGVRRTVLQELLRERAAELGVRFEQARISSVTQSDECVQAAGFSARYLVGADGLHSQVRTALGIPAVPGARHRFGVRQHFSIMPWTDVVEVYWLPDVEVYVTPVARDCVGIAALGPAPLDLMQAIARVPSLARRLQDAVPASAARGAGPMRVDVRRRRQGRALLVGDAAGYVDALTGEGLRIGFAQAKSAVRCIVRDRLEGYEADWSSITRSYRYLTSALVFAAQQRHIRAGIVPAASSMPALFTRIVNVL